MKFIFSQPPGRHSENSRPLNGAKQKCIWTNERKKETRRERGRDKGRREGGKREGRERGRGWLPGEFRGRCVFRCSLLGHDGTTGLGFVAIFPRFGTCEVKNERNVARFCGKIGFEGIVEPWKMEGGSIWDIFGMDVCLKVKGK